jgi:hypothetical protein
MLCARRTARQRVLSNTPRPNLFVRSSEVRTVGNGPRLTTSEEYYPTHVRKYLTDPLGRVPHKGSWVAGTQAGNLRFHAAVKSSAEVIATALSCGGEVDLVQFQSLVRRGKLDKPPHQEKTRGFRKKRRALSKLDRRNGGCYSPDLPRAVTRVSEMSPLTIAEPDHLACGGVTHRRRKRSLRSTEDRPGWPRMLAIYLELPG